MTKAISPARLNDSSAALDEALYWAYQSDMMRAPYGGRIIHQYKKSVQGTCTGRTLIIPELGMTRGRVMEPSAWTGPHSSRGRLSGVVFE
jgi:hypothetical protein